MFQGFQQAESPGLVSPPAHQQRAPPPQGGQTGEAPPGSQRQHSRSPTQSASLRREGCSCRACSRPQRTLGIRAGAAADLAREWPESWADTWGWGTLRPPLGGLTCREHSPITTLLLTRPPGAGLVGGPGAWTLFHRAPLPRPTKLLAALNCPEAKHPPLSPVPTNAPDDRARSQTRGIRGASTPGDLTHLQRNSCKPGRRGGLAGLNKQGEHSTRLTLPRAPAD